METVYRAAAFAGLAIAAIGAIGAPRTDALGIGAAAVVDGRPIPREAVTRAVEALANDKRNPVTEGDERAALERLIEEELLVQRGLALGLAETDLAARKAIVQSVLQLAVAERAGREPDEQTLRQFHAENAALFAPTSRVRATLVYLGPGRNVAGAEAALRVGRTPTGDPQALALPGSPLSAGELRTYLGGALATRALAARVGEVIVETDAGGTRLLRIDAIETPPAVRYEDVAAQVRAEWDRRADEAAVRAYIERLKARARITRAT